MVSLMKLYCYNAIHLVKGLFQVLIRNLPLHALDVDKISLKYAYLYKSKDVK